MVKISITKTEGLPRSKRINRMTRGVRVQIISRGIAYITSMPSVRGEGLKHCIKINTMTRFETVQK